MAHSNSLAQSLIYNTWNETGLRNLLIASVPTEVLLESVEAGKGPPWVIEVVTSTPNY